MMAGVTTLIHIFLVLYYGYGINVYIYGLSPPEEVLKTRKIIGGPFKYLTFWDLLLQFIYFTLAFVNDILGSHTHTSKNQSVLQKVRDFLFSTIVFALGSFVTVSFWGLYHIDRDLIFPEDFDVWFPNWLNHNVHTVPLLAVLIELYLVPHTFPKRNTGLGMVAFLCLFYLIWVCFIAYHSGYWVYPVLADLSVIGRTLFISSLSVLISLFYIMGEFLNKKIWGDEPQQKKVQ